MTRLYPGPHILYIYIYCSCVNVLKHHNGRGNAAQRNVIINARLHAHTHAPGSNHTAVPNCSATSRNIIGFHPAAPLFPLTEPSSQAEPLLSKRRTSSLPTFVCAASSSVLFIRACTSSPISYTIIGARGMCLCAFCKVHIKPHAVPREPVPCVQRKAGTF